MTGLCQEKEQFNPCVSFPIYFNFLYTGILIQHSCPFIISNLYQ